MAFGVAGASYAAAGPCPATSVSTLPGVYVGAGLGMGGMNTPKLTTADLTAVGATSGTYKLHKSVAARGYLGYLWAIPQVQNLQLGAELGYNYYPKNKYTASSANGTDSWNYKGYNIDLLGVAKYNFGDSRFNALVKAGGAWVNQKLVVNRPVPLVPNNLGDSKSQVKIEVAGGLGYDINQNIDVNVIYAHVFGSKPGGMAPATATKSRLNKVASVDTLMLTAAYHFGNLGGIV